MTLILAPELPDSAIVEHCSTRKLIALCAQKTDCLVHLYWPHRAIHCEHNILHLNGRGFWLLMATPGHGVFSPLRPTINFLVANDEFARGFLNAALARGITHGVVFRRAEIEALADTTGFEFAEVRVGHPHGFGEYEREEGWRYDIGQRRIAALHDLRYATVARLATPLGSARRVHVPANAVVAWW